MNPWFTVNRLAGGVCYRAGWPRSYNPHPAGSAARREWRLGWLGAQRAESTGEAALDPAGLCVERSA